MHSDEVRNHYSSDEDSSNPSVDGDGAYRPINYNQKFQKAIRHRVEAPAPQQHKFHQGVEFSDDEYDSESS